MVIVCCRDLLPTANSKVQLIEGAVNNLPDERSQHAAMDIYDLLQSLTEHDIALTLVSGMPCDVFLTLGMCGSVV